MNTLAVIGFFVAVATAHAGYLPLHETGALLKGPSARSTIVGADGVGISTHFEGGVVAPTHEVSVAVPEVVPVVARHEPLVHHVEQYIARAEPAYVPAPVISTLEHGRSDIIAGPSGTIVTNKDVTFARSHIAQPIPIQHEPLVIPAIRSYGYSSYIPRIDYGHHQFGRNYLNYW